MISTHYRLDDYHRTIAEVLVKPIPFHQLEVYLNKAQPSAKITCEGNSVILTGDQGRLGIAVHFTLLDQITTKDGKIRDHIRVHLDGNGIYDALWKSDED